MQRLNNRGVQPLGPIRRLRPSGQQREAALVPQLAQHQPAVAPTPPPAYSSPPPHLGRNGHFQLNNVPPPEQQNLALPDADAAAALANNSDDILARKEEALTRREEISLRRDELVIHREKAWIRRDDENRWLNCCMIFGLLVAIIVLIVVILLQQLTLNRLVLAATL